MNESSGLRVQSISINGFKALASFELQPNGKSVAISGHNGAGKSSVIDAIWTALTGKEVPGVPVRVGSDRATIKIDLAEYVVEWQATTKGTKLTVTNAGGGVMPQPRTFLDKVVGDISFDPIAFVDAQPAKQLAALKKILGLDFSDLDTAKRAALDAKNSAEADRKAIERQAAELADAVETERADAAAIIAHQRSRDEAAADARGAEDDARRAAEASDQAARHLAAAQETAKRAAEAVTRAEDTANRYATAATSAANEAADCRAKADAIPDRSAELATVDKTNAAAEKWERKCRLASTLRAAAVAETNAADRVKAVDAERAQRMTAAKLPVDGLAMTEDGITFRGLPFDRGNQCVSDIMRVGVAVAVALKPGVRIVRLKDGSLLDPKSRAEVLAMLQAQGFQAFIEEVGGDPLAAVVIESGEA